MSNNGIIKNTVIDVAQRVIKQESKTNKKLDNILNKKFEKVELDKVKYIDILKYNVLFYKTLSRNMEPLIGKWILEKNIPDINELQDDIELMNARCRKYINNAKANGIDGLKEADAQSFTYYDRMGTGDCIKRLQKDYKVLNIYIEVLSMTLKELSYKKDESVEIFLMNPSEAKMELKREIIVIVNRILAGGSKESEEKAIDEAYIKRIKMITDAEITEASNDELKRVLTLENLSEEEAYGVSGKYAYIFAAATVLLEFVKGEKRIIIEGAMRLTANGEFGEENFGNFMENAISKKSIIKSETWEEAVKYFMDEKTCIESTEIAMLNRIVPADINEDDYIYALENEDQTEPFKNKMNRKIEPAMIIPGIITKNKEEKAVEDTKAEEVIEVSAEDIKAAEKLNEEPSEEKEYDNQDSGAEENLAEDIEKEASDEEVSEGYDTEEDEEENLALNRRREQLIERERAEKAKEEEIQRKLEEEEKKKDPVERAKKGIEELKSEIEGDLEEPSYDVEDSKEEKSDLDIISDIVGIKEDMDEDEEEAEVEEEEETKKKGLSSLFGGKKNKKSEEEVSEEEEVVEESDEEEEYEEEDPEELKEYEKKVKEIKRKKAEDKKKRRKLDMIIAILIVAVAAGGYGLTVKRQKQQERIKQEQIKQEQQEQARKEAEEKRKEEEAKKIAEEESARLAEMEKVKSGGEYYKVYAGAFKEQDKAESLIINLGKKGFKGELVHIGNYYKAVVGGDIGAYPEAEKQMKALKAKGFDSYIEKYDKYCDLKIEDFRLKAEYMNKEEIESAYKDLNNELKKRKNYQDYSKILERTYNELIESK